MTVVTVLDAVADALRRAGRYNRDDKVPPAAVLWTDPERLWEPLLPQLRDVVPVISLGEFSEAERVGPAIWLRYALLSSEPMTDPTVVYLPGVERTHMRAIESCPAEVRAIAELQFRSSWWLQSNQSAWTPTAFLRSADGLGLDVARGDAIKTALQGALLHLAAASVEDLRRHGPIDADYLNGLLVSDEVKTLLDWLSDPVSARAAVTQNEWSAFLARCRDTFDIDPESSGQVSVAAALGARRGPWAKAWLRFTEAPHSYPGIPDQLRKARPQTLLPEHAASWPQDNEDAEGQLASALRAVGDLGDAPARKRVVELEDEHRPRRASVWAQLGHAPLASGLEKLNELAEITKQLPGVDSAKAFLDWYTETGWRADAAAVSALSRVTEPARRTALGHAIRAIYLPWADESARRFQDLVTAGGSVGETGLAIQAGDCVLFVDGLRYDVGEQLRSDLAARGATAEIHARFAAFPTMTSSGKPAVAPLSRHLAGGSELEVLAEGKLVDAGLLRKLLAEDGCQTVVAGETGDPTGRGWTETGDLDSTGHKLGLKLVDRIASEVSDIASRTRELLDAGWKRVHVVTDHGWLLMPGDLPKVELAQHLAVVRKSRCARLASGAGAVQQPTAGWTWDTSVRIVSPRGVAAFVAGCTYEHGGLSPQESITPHLVVTRSGAPTAAAIELVKWQGMRCRVDVVDAPAGSTVDVRRQAGDAGSTLAKAPAPVQGETEVKVLVQDPDSLGEAVYVVLVSDPGEILAQVETRVGGVT